MHKASLGDTEILSNYCVVHSFPVPIAVQTEFAPIIHYLLAIIVWMDKFLAPKLCLVWAAFLSE